MEITQFKTIAHLKGLDFVKKLMELEEHRFTESQFFKDSTFADINIDFGIFPKMAAYPVYFAGNIVEPEDKTIFIGINPAFNEEDMTKELTFLKEYGSFKGYCELFKMHFKNERLTNGLLPRYQQSIADFISYYDHESVNIDCDWFQNHFIALNLIPYHSKNINGLQINDYKKFREIYFEILLKLLDHLAPKKPVFINGFPTYKSLLCNTRGRKEFEESMLKYTEHLTIDTYHKFWKGKIGGHDFIGLPFLSRLRKKGALKMIAKSIKENLL